MTPAPAGPSSTYRLQISEQFTLHDAASVVGYLARLGVGALYVSPLLRSSQGSTHGYDVVDHAVVDPARGGREGLEELVAVARRAGIALVVDIVPNHMGVADPAQNRAWWELLRGRTRGRVRLLVRRRLGCGRWSGPAPGAGRRLRSGARSHDRGGGLRYGDHLYPLAAGTEEKGDGAASVHLRQHYRLISDRLAATELNYRRFFAISDLAGLRVEDPEVFAVTHREILRWVTDYGVRGIRIDHPDGLAAPGEYLQRLAAAAPDVWIVVEKITQLTEEMPAGLARRRHDRLRRLGPDQCRPDGPAGRGDARDVYLEATGDKRSWTEHVSEGKHQVATTLLQAEFRRLARLAVDVDRAEAGADRTRGGVSRLSVVPARRG